MNRKEWFDGIRDMLEAAYLKGDTPWMQSGFSGPYERWVALRKPIADCVTSDGAFLDIGCANGYLPECILAWTSERGITIEPWGLDLSEKLLELAKQRLPEHADNLHHGNCFYWNPPRQFDYVRTELCYVPDELRVPYVSRLLDEFLSSDGKLLVAEYRGRKDTQTGLWVDDILGDAGFEVASCVSGYWEGKELTRIAILPK